MAVEATPNVSVPVKAPAAEPKKDGAKAPAAQANPAAAKAPEAKTAAPATTPVAPKNPETAGTVGAGPGQATPTTAQGHKLYAMA